MEASCVAPSTDRLYNLDLDHISLIGSLIAWSAQKNHRKLKTDIG